MGGGIARVLQSALLLALAAGAFAWVPLERGRRRERWARCPHVAATVLRFEAGRHAGGRNGIDYRARRYAYERGGVSWEARGPDLQQALWFDEQTPGVGAAVTVAVCLDDPSRAIAEADIDAVNDRVVPPLVGVLLVIAAIVNARRPRAAPVPSGHR